MSEWKKYQRTNLAEMTPYVPGMEMGHVSISEPDHQNGSPKVGDMVARNPENHADKWLVAENRQKESDVKCTEMIIHRSFDSMGQEMDWRVLLTPAVRHTRK